MIKTEKEYIKAKKRLAAEFQSIEEQNNKMKTAKMTIEQIHLVLEPLTSFTLQLKEEIEEYENIKRGQFNVLKNLSGIGRLLVAIRIAKGMKQKELAAELDVKEAQVSRDERNEYHGASVQKIDKVLLALGIKMTSKVDVDLQAHKLR